MHIHRGAASISTYTESTPRRTIPHAQEKQVKVGATNRQSSFPVRTQPGPHTPCCLFAALLHITTQPASNECVGSNDSLCNDRRRLRLPVDPKVTHDCNSHHLPSSIKRRSRLATGSSRDNLDRLQSSSNCSSWHGPPNHKPTLESAFSPTDRGTSLDSGHGPASSITPNAEAQRGPGRGESISATTIPSTQRNLHRARLAAALQIVHRLRQEHPPAFPGKPYRPSPLA